jgi:phosphoserine aminotransferase
MSHPVYNFSAGPAVLPRPVLERARAELVDYRGTGMSVMEMSHRSPAYEAIHEGARAKLAELLAVPEGFTVLLLQGGASLQFSMVPMNLLRTGADYLVTGSWSNKALAEARKVGSARVAASGEAGGFTRIPAAGEIDLDPAADYVHLTSNNTLFGTRWSAPPDTAGVPLVADMSSDVMSRPVDWPRYGLVYAGAQKNLGPAGVTVVVVRDDLLDRAPETLASMLAYRTHAAARSLYNTPPCWAIYVLGLACEWVAEQGGVAAMERAAEARAARLYALLDAGGIYRGTAEPASRSRMNVTFRLPTPELEARFLAEAATEGLVNLKGHRSVGGVRASLYNAMPMAGVEALCGFMERFEADVPA